MQNQTLFSQGVPLPGLYASDPKVLVRPPPIPITIIKRTNTRKAATSSSQAATKDVHRWVKAVADVGKYVREHNEVHKENPQMQYRWYDESLSDKDIQKTLYRIVDDKAREHIQSLYGCYTYNEAQIRHGREMENFVSEVAKEPMFDPLTQTARMFGVRSIIETKMTTKRRCRIQKERREAKRIQQELELPYENCAPMNSEKPQLEAGPSTPAIDAHSLPCEAQPPFLFKENQSVLIGKAVSVVADLPPDAGIQTKDNDCEPADKGTHITKPVSGEITDLRHSENQITKQDGRDEIGSERISSSDDDTEEAISLLEDKLKQLKKKRKKRAVRGHSGSSIRKRKKKNGKTDSVAFDGGSGIAAVFSGQETNSEDRPVSSRSKTKKRSIGPAPRSGLSRKVSKTGRRSVSHPKKKNQGNK